MIHELEEIINDTNSHPVVIDIARMAADIETQLGTNEITKDEAQNLYTALKILKQVQLDNMLDDDRQTAYNVLQMLRQAIDLIPMH